MRSDCPFRTLKSFSFKLQANPFYTPLPRKISCIGRNPMNALWFRSILPKTDRFWWEESGRIDEYYYLESSRGQRVLAVYKLVKS